MHYQIRPLVMWDRDNTVGPASSGRFRADWHSTLRLLAFEIEQLGGDHFVIELDVDEADIRIDGQLKAGAKVRTDRVRISFDSKHGPLRYATDAYTSMWSGDMAGWRANVRAIALGLQALRAVDRYGISTRAEQYVGYKAIGAGRAGIAGRELMDIDVAYKVISEESGYSVEGMRADSAVLRTAIRKAQGDGEPWNAVAKAVETITASEQ